MLNVGLSLPLVFLLAVDVSWRNTTIRELPNNMMIVPNAQLAASRFRNYYHPDRELAVLVPERWAYLNSR
jgi:small-conductance mechanosensitive channel